MLSAPRTAAIVLAAGRGTRMGGPKALLLLAGEPLVLIQARRLACVAPEIVVVLPPSIDAATIAWPRAVTTVISHAPDPAGSLAVGLARAAGSAQLVLVAPVDALPVTVSTLRALLAAMTPELDAATPTYRGRGGHPVVVRRNVLDARDAAPTLRDRLSALGPRRARIACDDDPAIVSSFNTPRDVEASRTGGLDLAFAVR